MNTGLIIAGSLASAATGAVMEYYIDPDRGAARRALLRDKIAKSSRQARRELRRETHDISNRLSGMVAEARKRVERSEPVSDGVLEARVRSLLGRHVTNPSAVRVVSRQGTIHLYGSIIAAELRELIRAVQHTRGVEGVENDLVVYERPQHIPELQGYRNKPRRRSFARPRFGSALAASALSVLAVGAVVMTKNSNRKEEEAHVAYSAA